LGVEPRRAGACIWHPYRRMTGWSEARLIPEKPAPATAEVPAQILHSTWHEIYSLENAAAVASSLPQLSSCFHLLRPSIHLLCPDKRVWIHQSHAFHTIGGCRRTLRQRTRCPFIHHHQHVDADGWGSEKGPWKSHDRLQQVLNSWIQKILPNPPPWY